MTGVGIHDTQQLAYVGFVQVGITQFFIENGHREVAIHGPIATEGTDDVRLPSMRLDERVRSIADAAGLGYPDRMKGAHLLEACRTDLGWVKGMPLPLPSVYAREAE